MSGEYTKISVPNKLRGTRLTSMNPEDVSMLLQIKKEMNEKLDGFSFYGVHGRPEATPAAIQRHHKLLAAKPSDSPPAEQKEQVQDYRKLQVRQFHSQGERTSALIPLHQSAVVASAAASESKDENGWLYCIQDKKNDGSVNIYSQEVADSKYFGEQEKYAVNEIPQEHIAAYCSYNKTHGISEIYLSEDLTQIEKERILCCFLTGFPSTDETHVQKVLAELMDLSRGITSFYEPEPTIIVSEQPLTSSVEEFESMLQQSNLGKTLTLYFEKQQQEFQGAKDRFEQWKLKFKTTKPTEYEAWKREQNFKEGEEPNYEPVHDYTKIVLPKDDYISAQLAQEMTSIQTSAQRNYPNATISFYFGTLDKNDEHREIYLKSDLSEDQQKAILTELLSKKSVSLDVSIDEKVNRLMERQSEGRTVSGHQKYNAQIVALRKAIPETAVQENISAILAAREIDFDQINNLGMTLFKEAREICGTGATLEEISSLVKDTYRGCFDQANNYINSLYIALGTIEEVSNGLTQEYKTTDLNRRPEIQKLEKQKIQEITTNAINITTAVACLKSSLFGNDLNMQPPAAPDEDNLAYIETKKQYLESLDSCINPENWRSSAPPTKASDAYLFRETSQINYEWAEHQRTHPIYVNEMSKIQETYRKMQAEEKLEDDKERTKPTLRGHLLRQEATASRIVAPVSDWGWKQRLGWGALAVVGGLAFVASNVVLGGLPLLVAGAVTLGTGVTAALWLGTHEAAHRKEVQTAKQTAASQQAARIRTGADATSRKIALTEEVRYDNVGQRKVGARPQTVTEGVTSHISDTSAQSKIARPKTVGVEVVALTAEEIKDLQAFRSTPAAGPLRGNVVSKPQSANDSGPSHRPGPGTAKT